MVFRKMKTPKKLRLAPVKNDSGHAANDGEMNDDNAAEADLAQALYPGKGPVAEPDQVGHEIDGLENHDTDQSAEQMVGIENSFRRLLFREHDKAEDAKE
jgi:hypothetical protein